MAVPMKEHTSEGHKDPEMGGGLLYNRLPHTYQTRKMRWGTGG